MDKLRSAAARFFLTGGLLALSHLSLAATYYVATTGSDSNPGTSASPFLTIQKGVNAAAAGDTILVGNGTYNVSASNGILVAIASNGTASSPITLKAQNPGQVFLTGGNNAAEYGIQVTGSYWNIIGFDISKFWYVGIFGSAGSNVLIQNNVIHNIGNITSSSSTGFDGIFVSGVSNWTINGNTIHDIGRLSGLSSPNHDHGIYAGYNVTANILITNNIFYNALYGWHIQLYPSGFTGTIANNTFYGPAGQEVANAESGSIMLALTANTSLLIQNNIFYNPNSYALNSGYETEAGGATCAIQNNIVYNTASASLGLLSSPVTGCSSSGNLLNVNPNVVSAASLNFNLTSGSPAIGAGLALASVPADFSGASRSGRNDVGAFQYAGGATGGAPVISAVSASAIGPTAATILWTTNVAADSQVKYGLTTAYGSQTTLSAALTTSHSVALTGLTASTVYHYAVLSHNSAGALTTSPDATFTTTGSALPPGCVASSASSWQNVSLAAQTGSFTVQFSGTPTANMDGVSGLSNGAATAFTSQAVAVRFNNTGTIDARNAGAYTAATSIPYVAGLSYVFTLVVNLPTRTYSAYVTQGSNAQQTIGLNYAFRTEQGSATTLNDFGMMADIGSFTACNPTVSASAPPTVISAVAASAIGPTVATIGWTTNNPSSSQVSYGPTTAYGTTSTPNTAAVTSHSVALGGLTAGTLYHYQAISTDAGGNVVKSPDATFTTAAAVVAAPVISAVSATGIGGTSATIEWTTNIAASGQVAYGPTTSYGSLTTLNTTLTTSHSAALSGLTAGTVYHYAVGSQATGGPIATSPDATFTTTTSGTTTPPAGCVTSSANAWQNVPLTSQTGAFTATFQATPSLAKEDGVMGLSNGAASAFTSQAAIVRFNNTGTIDARNAGAYTAASAIPYTPGLPYQFQLVVNLKTHTYSAYVTQGSGAQQTIGLNYAFRTEQKAAALLNNLGVVDDTIGSVTVCSVVP